MISHFPHFIEDKLVHCSNLNISRKQRSKLALIRNLHLYEVYNKQILHTIDLQHTILRKIQYKFDSIEPEVNVASSQACDIFTNSKTIPNSRSGGIMFGKYIYLNRNDKVVFLLIKCWNSMVVIKRDFKGFFLHAEYENVRSFKVSKGNYYQGQVSITFLHNDCNEVTNFQERSDSSTAFDLPTEDVYRKMIDRINIQKSELLVHQTISRKEFYKLKTTQLFGCNILRTPRLEELQILSKCGNSWIKLTANDDVVIGISLVNNCSMRLTILRNFRAVLQGAGNLIHSFKLYQLNKTFCDTESIQSFFYDSQFDEKYSTNCSWRQCLDLNLRPEAFCVLVLKLKIQELFFECGPMNAPLFVLYDVCTANRIFNQKCFLTCICLRDIFSNKSCMLKFDETNLHRDLLTVIASSHETGFRLEYMVSGDAFEDFLCRKLGFDRISGSRRFSEEMNVDGQDDAVDGLIKKKVIFYNKNINSVWHGTLIKIAHLNEFLAYVRLFTKSREKSKVLLKQLRLDLRDICGIKNVQENLKNMMTKLVDFEAAMRDECLSCLETYPNSAMGENQVDIDKKELLHNHLHLKQLKTDIVFKDLFS